MAFKPEEIKRLQSLADEMVKLIEDKDGTSAEAVVVYGKIGGICARAIANDAAAAAKRATRQEHVLKFQTARQARNKKPGTNTPSTQQGTSQAQQSQRRP